MRSIYDNVKSLLSLAPIEVTADAEGTAIDTKGFNTAKLVITAGVVKTSAGNETYLAEVQECDTSDGDFADTGIEVAITATGVQNLRVDGLGTSRKRYLKVSLDLAGTNPSAVLSCVFELGRAYANPVQVEA